MRLVSGDRDALEACYETLSPMVLGYVTRMLPRADAEEVTQTTFLELWRTLDRYDPERSLEAWLLAIARKRAIDVLRRRRRDVVSLDEVVRMPHVSDDVAERGVEGTDVRSALGRLPEGQRSVIHMAYFGGMTQQEISEHLGLPLGTVKARTFRGLRAMRRLLEPEAA